MEQKSGETKTPVTLSVTGVLINVSLCGGEVPTRAPEMR